MRRLFLLLRPQTRLVVDTRARGDEGNNPRSSKDIVYTIANAAPFCRSYVAKQFKFDDEKYNTDRDCPDYCDGYYDKVMLISSPSDHLQPQELRGHVRNIDTRSAQPNTKPKKCGATEAPKKRIVASKSFFPTQRMIKHRFSPTSKEQSRSTGASTEHHNHPLLSRHEHG